MRRCSTNPPSRAGEFFKTITGHAATADFLKSLVNTTPPNFRGSVARFQMWLHPEKLVRPLSDDNIKKIWSKALGSMANTEGGVLIWGIHAAKKTQKPKWTPPAPFSFAQTSLASQRA